MEADERLRTMKSEMRARLGAVCAQWPPELFDAMLDELVRITLKYDHLITPGTYDRRSTDRLVEELKAALNESVERRKDST